MKAKDPLERFEITPDISPRQRLKTAGAAFGKRPKKGTLIWWWIAILAIAIATLVGLSLAK